MTKWGLLGLILCAVGVSIKMYSNPTIDEQVSSPLQPRKRAIARTNQLYVPHQIAQAFTSDMSQFEKRMDGGAFDAIIPFLEQAGVLESVLLYCIASEFKRDNAFRGSGPCSMVVKGQLGLGAATRALEDTLQGDESYRDLRNSLKWAKQNTFGGSGSNLYNDSPDYRVLPDDGCEEFKGFVKGTLERMQTFVQKNLPDRTKAICCTLQHMADDSLKFANDHTSACASQLSLYTLSNSLNAFEKNTAALSNLIKATQTTIQALPTTIVKRDKNWYLCVEDELDTWRTIYRSEIENFNYDNCPDAYPTQPDPELRCDSLTTLTALPYFPTDILKKLKLDFEFEFKTKSELLRFAEDALHVTTSKIFGSDSVSSIPYKDLSIQDGKTKKNEACMQLVVNDGKSIKLCVPAEEYAGIKCKILAQKAKVTKTPFPSCICTEVH